MSVPGYIAPETLELTAFLLRMSANQFGNHGCNDFDLSKIISDPTKRNEFVRSFHEWNGDLEEESDDYLNDASTPDYRLMDYALMDFCAYLLDGKLT